jgi:LuxR family maltose regulon positive regulatory protein
MIREKEILTKVARPHISETYPRADLYNLLDELSATPLIRVCSCPGSGKSTLIASYIKNRNIPCLWYRVDRTDNDISAFFHNLRFAASKINPDYKAVLLRVSSERMLDMRALAKLYFQNLYRGISTPFMFVLDNYSALASRSALHEVIGEACAALPHGGRIVLISNSDRAPILPNLPADLGVATLCCEELQLNLQDIKEIADFHGVRLSSEQSVKQLHKKTEGLIGKLVHELRGEGRF